MSRRRALLVALLLVAGLVPPNLSTAQAKANDPGFDPVDLSRLVVEKRPQPLPFPLTGTSQPESAKPLGAGENGLYIVQFHGVIGQPAQEAMRAVGAEVGPYVGAQAFAVRLSSEAADKLTANPLVAQVLRFQPSWKVAPSAQSGDQLDLRVQTLGAPSRKAATRLQTMSAQVAGNNRFLVTGASAATAQELAAMEDVLVVEALPKERLLNDVARGIMKVSTAGGPWAQGLTGMNQVVGIADTGLDTGNPGTLHPDLRKRLQTAIAYGRPGDWSDPNGHGTHVAGSVLGDGTASNGQYKGVAPAAKIVFQSMLRADGGLYVPGGSVYGLLDAAYDAGARIQTNSWGHTLAPGKFYDSFAQDADRAVWTHRDMSVLFAAGNEGQYGTMTIASPGVAKNVITVGASESNRPNLHSIADNPNEVAYFSSQGPTADGRIKPDVVAPGTLILSTRSSLAPNDAFDPFLSPNPRYGYMSGTSMATPLVAGAAALTRQFYQQKGIVNPSAALIKATLINGAQDMGYGWGDPRQGWGRVDLTNSLYPVGRTNWFKEEGTGLWTGDHNVYDFDVSAGQIFKASLVWTDPPGSPLGNNPLINDLDLAVQYPDGTVHFGNCFVYKTEVPGQSCNSGDGGNTVENVYVQAPATGRYRVYVNGYQVVQGPQPYALTISGKGLVFHPDQVKPQLAVTASGSFGGTTELNGYLRGRIRIAAAASDDRGINKIELLVDGRVLPPTQVDQNDAVWDWDTTNLSGTKRLEIKAYDYSGNVTAQTYTPTIDNAPPVINGITPADGAYIKGKPTFNLAAQDNVGLATVSFRLMNTLTSWAETVRQSAPYQFTVDLTNGWADGPHQLDIDLADKAGWTVSRSYTYIVDNTPPTLELTTPEANAVLPGGTLPVTVNVGDNYGVTKVEYWVGNSKKGEESTAPFSWSWSTAGLSSGKYTLMAKAFDVAGNVTTVSRSVTLDTVAPTLTISGPTAGAAIHGTQRISATATDSNGIAALSYWVDGDRKQTLTASPFSWDWETGLVTDGPHTLLVRAQDPAGNLKEISTAVTVDNTAPAISLNLEAGALIRNGAVLAPTATDNLGISKVEVLVDGQVKATSTKSPYLWTVAGLTNGAHTILGRVTDKAGNVTATAAIPVTADSIAPTNVALSGLTANGTILGARPLTITGKDDLGVVRAELWLDSQLTATYPTTLATPLTITWDTTAAADGRHTVQAKVYDGAGNVTATSAVSVAVDNHAPVVGAITPGDGASIRGSATITAVVTDAVGLARVEFWVDGVLNQTKTDSPYAIALATTGTKGLIDGEHAVRVRAVDRAGNESEQTVHLKVDNTAPTVQLTAPAANSLLGPGPVTLSAAANDANAVSRVEFYVGNTKVGTVTAAPYIWSWNAATVSSGNYALKAVAVDAAGNATTSAVVSVKVDTTKPSAAFTVPAVGAILKGTVPVTATAADANGLQAVTLGIDGQSVGALQTGPFTWNLDTTLYADGPHKLTVMAVDVPGNMTLAERMVVIDNTAPTVSFTSLTDQSPVKPGAQVRITATDAVGVAKAQYYLDGALAATIYNSPFFWTLPSQLSNGSHTLRVVVTDRAGWTGESGTITVVADSTPPALTVSGILSYATVKGTVSITASSPDADTVRIEFWVGTTLAYSAGGGSAVWDWDTTKEANGTKSVKVIAYDAAGNATTRTFTSVRVRN